jgi:hypothetical protein
MRRSGQRGSGMRVWLVSITILAAIGIGFIVYRDAATTRSARSLLEFGAIALHDRLETRSPDERFDHVLFYFERPGWSFVPGGIPAIRERMSIAIWAEGAGPESRPDWEPRFRTLAYSQVGDLRWRSENDIVIGEGTHRVGMITRPAWMLMHRLVNEPVWIAYMLWQSDGKLEEAVATIREVAASFTPSMSQREFFKLVRQRPLERRATLMRVLAAKGIDLTPDGPAHVRGSTAYALSASQSWPEGAWLQVMHFLGSTPAGASDYRQNWHNHPRTVGNWPPAVYFAFRQGAWRHRSTRGDYWLAPELAARLAERHTDPGQVYFYAAYAIAADETPSEQFNLDTFMVVLPEMTAKFVAGELIEANQ